MDIKNICILAGIILLIILDLKIIFTCIAKSYIRRNKEKLFGANEPLTQVSKDLGYDLCNKLPQYQDCIKKLGIDQRYECSSSIVSNASNNAVKYLIKYSNITNSKECLEDIDFCINYMELLNELCANMKKLQANMEMQLPVIIRLFTKKEKLPYTICSVNYEIAKIKRPEFCFSYVSPAGRSGRSYTIKATPELLKNVRAEIGYKLSKIEDLDMKAMSQALNFGKSVSDNGWGMFTTFLKYKLEEQGKKLVKVGRFFASSQTCSVCGYKNMKTKNLALRAWDCPQCGTHHDRDVNAAINIRNEGMRLVIA